MSGQIASAFQGSARFFHWWTGELAGCLPARIRESVGRTGQSLVVEISDTRASFERVRGTSVSPLGSLTISPADLAGQRDAGQRGQVRRLIQDADLRSAEVVLRLPREKVLRRLVDLPAAAAENLREVLGFEMDRHTPFKADEVYYDFRVEGSDPQLKRIKADLVVVPKMVTDQAVRLMGSWGIHPHRMIVANDNQDSAQAFNLLPSTKAKDRRSMAQRMSLVFGLAACALLVLALYIPLERKRDLLEVVRVRLTDAKADALVADNIKTQVDEMVTRSRFVVEQKQQFPSATELLDEVTRLLPDHTWALKFGLRDRNLTLSGYSAKPSALIGLLERSELLTGVRFSSPVTKDQKVGLERFNLTAVVVGKATQ
jgi:general secretion pathway protein L